MVARPLKINNDHTDDDNYYSYVMLSYVILCLFLESESRCV